LFELSKEHFGQYSKFAFLKCFIIIFISHKELLFIVLFVTLIPTQEAKLCELIWPYPIAVETPASVSSADNID